VPGERSNVTLGMDYILYPCAPNLAPYIHTLAGAEAPRFMRVSNINSYYYLNNVTLGKEGRLYPCGTKPNAVYTRWDEGPRSMTVI
jgi:hypothetical protein